MGGNGENPADWMDWVVCGICVRGDESGVGADYWAEGPDPTVVVLCGATSGATRPSVAGHCGKAPEWAEYGGRRCLLRTGLLWVETTNSMSKERRGERETGMSGSPSPFAHRWAKPTTGDTRKLRAIRVWNCKNSDIFISKRHKGLQELLIL